MSRKRKPPAQASASELHPAQRWTAERVHRSQIKRAPYNPRKIDEASKARLRANLERVGLVEGLVWNRRSGTLVGGHQRLSILDALAESKDYLLDVCAVDLDEEQERAQNLILNNPSAQGWWDEAALEELLKSAADPAALANLAGFDAAELAGLVSDPELLPRLFAEEAQSPESQEAADWVRDAEEEIEENRERTAKHRDQIAKLRETDTPGHVLVVVCRSGAEVDALLRRLGAPVGSQYVDVARVAAALGLNL